MTTVASAQVSAAPFSPNTRFIVLSGLLAGLALAVAGALALETFDTRVRTQRDIERVGPQAFLGVIAKRKRSAGEQIVMLTDPHGAGAEDFRRIGTNLDFADIDNPIRSVVVTSSSPGEGKSSISVNLALAMAERFEKVLLIDADLRKPSIAEYCQIEGSVGLTSVLVGSATLEQAIAPWGKGTIDVLPSGLIPANPSQMLGTEAMADLFGRLIPMYDFIVVDSPPLLPVTDSLTIAKLTDGALVIARYKSTRRQQLAQALDSVEGVSARVIGTILNGVPRKDQDAYYVYVPVDAELRDILSEEPAGAARRDETEAVSPESPVRRSELHADDPSGDATSGSADAGNGEELADLNSDEQGVRDDAQGSRDGVDHPEQDPSDPSKSPDRLPVTPRRTVAKRFSSSASKPRRPGAASAPKPG